jgi:hypothetical protein
MLMSNHAMMSGAKAAFARSGVVAFARARVMVIKAPLAVPAWPGGEQRER